MRGLRILRRVRHKAHKLLDHSTRRLRVIRTVEFDIFIKNQHASRILGGPYVVKMVT